MGLLDKLEGIIESFLCKEPCEIEGTPEEKLFHHSLVEELSSRYGIDFGEGIMIANSIYNLPRHLDIYHSSPNDTINQLPTSPLIQIPFLSKKREYTKKILFSIMDENLYLGIKCGRADSKVFAMLIKNYEGVAQKLLNKKGRYAWMLFGLEVAEKNSSAGVMYFNLESTISNQKLEECTSAVKIANFSQSINLYLKGRTGKDVPLKLKEKLPADFQHLEQTIFTDGKYVYMPQEINQLDSKWLNERFAWRAATHEAGHVTERSFDVDGKVLGEMTSMLKVKYGNDEVVKRRLEKKEEMRKKLEEKKRQKALEEEKKKSSRSNILKPSKEEEKKNKAEDQAKFEEAFQTGVRGRKTLVSSGREESNQGEGMQVK